MQKNNIPTAAYQCFTLETVEEGKKFLGSLKAPYVLKADGLAAGKGVLIIDGLNEAREALEVMLKGQFGQASSRVVIEEFLSGIEVSYFVLTDGTNYVLLPEAKDYKRIGDNDQVPNTGGMGAVSPVPFCNNEFTQKVIDRIIEPTVKGLKKDNITYKGFIFFGLVKVGNEPYVIEYNVRMGDPETEVVVPRVKSDLLELFQAVSTGKLNEVPFEIETKSAVTVVMVSGGYPGDYEKGFQITGTENAPDSIVFHAGTMLKNQDVLTNGGRVLAITSLGETMKECLEKSYKSIENIKFEKAYYRRDIGLDLQK
jgi:phosphoribosylamine--glycine ligase